MYVGVTLIFVGGLVGALTEHWIGWVLAVGGFCTIWWEGIREAIENVLSGFRGKK